MRKRFYLASTLLLLSAFLAACAEDLNSDPVPVPNPIVQPVSLRATATAGVTETPAAIATPDDVPAAVQTVTQALRSGSSAELGALLLDNVWLAPQVDASGGSSSSRDDGASWLKQRWAGRVAVVSVNYVRDAALLEITTGGWGKQAPLEEGTIIFHLHRYDSGGQENDMQGTWRVDTILYQ